MNRFGKSLLTVAAAAVLAAGSMSAASADYRWHHHHGGDGWVAGAAGLAAGLIVGSAIANQPAYIEPEPDYPPPPPRYYRPPPRAYAAPDEAYYGPDDVALRPWSPEWMRYCYDRYATFDSRTGTYVGYDGARHFCTAG